VLYHIFSRALFRSLPRISLDEILNIVTWAGFLILTAAVIGIIAEQREARMRSLQGAYAGVLEIMLKYLEVADERKPRSVRVAHLAGKIAAAAKMDTIHVENIKSAALLLEAGDLRSNLHLYDDVAAFMEAERIRSGKAVDDKAKILLRTTASLLKEVEPILANYFYHYVEEADVLDKDLTTVPMDSSIIALADLVDRLNTDMLPAAWKKELTSLQDIRHLSGRAFPGSAVQALFQVLSASP
jgi:response regulator RpfG family c-di-GMP phosphodiesterase